MKIQALEKQDKGLYDVQFSDGSSMTMHEETVVRFQLLPGKTVNTAELQSIQDQLNIDQAYIKAIQYISYKLRSEHEINKYLEEDYTEAVRLEVIERLQKEGYINDTKYAEALMETMYKTTIKGPGELRRTLKDHRVDEEIIQNYVDEFDTRIDSERMNGLKDKALKRHKGSMRQFKQKFRLTMTNKGYSSHHLALVNYDETSENYDEHVNLERDFDKAHKKYQRKFNGYELKVRILQALARKGYAYDYIQDNLGGKLDELEHDDPE